MKRLLLAIGLLGVLIQQAQSAAENGILGDPYVNCGPNGIEVRFDTRNPFKGVVFVKDQLEWPECRSAPIDADSNGFRNASISLNFKDCGLERRRSVSLFFTPKLP
ncbi:unnamed protein product [Bursaphelenchus xylophilus]|uniref:(pine wood nematode) hypothetical protein n=1 Tax=Bursaphelenchus xylophilus TaxID=6326 RepID=A0A1I7RZC0_BURXY|nr:unnamed protein product [Bursaphelenchus xylophilus]CAG9106628.1 unnamed protein product [Bursaphelenchus xylophilus]